MILPLLITNKLIPEVPFAVLSILVPERCPECGSTHIKFGGLGTEKIEEEIQAMFPTARVARMDTDSTRGKFSHQRIIESFENKEIDILVGTQMVSKGLDFDNVNLIGILDADSLMHFPEFRAFERAFQTITQIMGRAGRRENNGRVFLNAKLKHPIIAMLVNGLFHDFYRNQKINDCLSIPHSIAWYYPSSTKPCPLPEPKN